MNKRLPKAWSLFVAGCLALWSCKPTKGLRQQLAQDSARFLDCPEEEVRIENHQSPTWLEHGHKWIAKGCRKEAQCFRGMDPNTHRSNSQCELMAEEAVSGFADRAVVHLSKQMACPPERIAVEDAVPLLEVDTGTPNPANRLRLQACGIAYVCEDRQGNIECLGASELKSGEGP